MVQLAMTVGNAAVAMSLLLSQYYDAETSAPTSWRPVGAMNLLAVPLGGLPMCHDSGGVAGKHAFGGRTVGANLVLGGLYAVAALVAAELARARAGNAAPPHNRRCGLLGLLTNVGVAFVAGAVGSLLLERYRGDEPTA
ncbi:putative sulfate/molybdate transporter [Halolamina sp.]|jgi:hypothetical protein|uniref:putative sulfate/molybdate transporter n=1 Tax=Halolamina sp. TaxID=1940283 RepID=UPI000677652A